MKPVVMDSRTGAPLAAGDVVQSLERGDRLRVESVGEVRDALGASVMVTLSPVSEPFRVRARESEELGGLALPGYWRV